MTKFPKVRRTFLKRVALMGFLFCVGCQSLFYHPSKGRLFDPARIRMAPEDVYLKTLGGDTLHGWYFSSTDSKPSKGTLVFFHGNAENLSSHFLMFHWLPSKGYNFFIFDYPGYGFSTGKPTPENTVEAGMAAIQWVHQAKDTRPLIIYGHSLGGAIALRSVEELKGQIPLQAMVIEGSFPSYRQMSREVLSRRWWTWLFTPITYLAFSDKYAVSSLKSFAPTPLLFIHGDADPAVSVNNSRQMYEEAHDPKELWIVPGGGHGNLYEINQGMLREQLLSYLAKTSTVSK